MSNQQTVSQIANNIAILDISSMTNEELERVLPLFGMNGENVSEMPSELSEYFNQGIRFWQYPNQFAKYLKHIHQYDIDSYMEIGCRWGGTFIITTEILRKKNHNLKAIACDLIGPTNIMLDYYSHNKSIQYVQGDSLNITRSTTGGDVDLILIDGDHSYDGVKGDFENCLQLNPKYVVFHDITNDACPGTVSFWQEIKSQYKHFEFTDQYESVNGSYLGIGLIEL